MKRSLAIAFLAALLPVSASDEVKSTVRFSNNDRLTGSVASLTPERLVWNSSILEKPVSFLLKNILDLTLPAEHLETEARHEAAIRLTNGDLIRGQLVSVSDEIVELDTWFAGRMKFNRLMIADIRIRERPNFIYRGPAGLDGWQQSDTKPAWIYQNSAFRSVDSGSISRNVNLPDECFIAFDASWRSSLGLRLVFFSEDLTSNQPRSGYEINFQQRNVTFRGWKQQQQRFLGQTQNALSLQENEKARIEIRASLKSGKVCLFVDGEIIEVWTDPDVARNEVGRGIHFIASTSSAPLQISHIEVGAWDGELDQVPNPRIPGGMQLPGMHGGQEMEDEPEPVPATAEKPETGRMELRNGDSLAGQVVSIDDGIITVKTPFRDVRLPVETLRSLALKPVDEERCKREKGDVRAWLPDGSSLVFRLESAGEGILTGSSQNFGTARFKSAAFSRIEFNIYDPDFEGVRMGNGW
ncbi:MAG TPA: hypothetical protein VF258_06775 [Luteolibacter sp.]